MSRITFVFVGVTLAIFTLAGCMKAIQAPMELSRSGESCISQVARVESARMQRATQQYTDPTQALLAAAIEALATVSRADPYLACFEEMRAYYAANTAVIQANATLWRAGIGAATIPASILSGAVAADVLMSGAGRAIDITAESSDIVIDSGAGEGAVVGRSSPADSPNIQNPTTTVDQIPPNSIIFPAPAPSATPVPTDVTIGINPQLPEIP